jgi:Ca-activated chloride channel family protein
MAIFIYDKRGAVPCPWIVVIPLFFVICLLIPLFAHAASFSSDIKEGNRYYKKGEYDKALEQYEAAEESSPDSDIVNFNKGTAYYRKGRYQEAIESFTKALNTEDKKTEADSTYNIANAKYKLGSSSEDRDMNSAVRLYRESLDYYKRAVELDEGNRDARYNHELVERKLKILLDKLKNQEKHQGEDRDKGQENDKKEEQKSDSKESGSNKAKKEEDRQSRQARNDQKMKEQKSDQQQAVGGDAGQEKEAVGQEKKNGGMSSREARMLLDAFGEQEAREAVKNEKKTYYPEVLKDW